MLGHNGFLKQVDTKDNNDGFLGMTNETDISGNCMLLSKDGRLCTERKMCNSSLSHQAVSARERLRFLQAVVSCKYLDKSSCTNDGTEHEEETKANGVSQVVHSNCLTRSKVPVLKFSVEGTKSEPLRHGCRPSLLSQQSRTSVKMNVVSSEHNVYLHMVQNEDVEIAPCGYLFRIRRSQQSPPREPWSHRRLSCRRSVANVDTRSGKVKSCCCCGRSERGGATFQRTEVPEHPE